MKTIPLIAVRAIITRYLLLVIVLSAPSVACFSQEKENGIHIGIVYPLSTHGTFAGEYSNIFSLHAIAGLSREEKGFTWAGFANFIKEDAYGFQAAGFMNHIGGYAQGFKTAGFLNIYNSGLGFQNAGFANLAKSNVTGVQAAGFMNMAADLRGFQGSGFFNKARQVHGAQAAGFINIAEDVHGVQLGGFINIAKKVKGVQLAGFINIADSSDYPIGIINIVKNGEKSIGISTDDNLTTLVTFRSGGRKLYGIIGMGYNFENSKEVYALQSGLGAHFFTGDKFRLNVEATVVHLENFKRGDFTKSSLSILPALRLHNKIELFAGPSINFVNTNSKEGRDLIDHFAWHDTSNNGHLHGFYIGYMGGIHWML